MLHNIQCQAQEWSPVGCYESRGGSWAFRSFQKMGRVHQAAPAEVVGRPRCKSDRWERFKLIFIFVGMVFENVMKHDAPFRSIILLVIQDIFGRGFLICVIFYPLDVKTDDIDVVFPAPARRLRVDISCRPGIILNTKQPGEQQEEAGSPRAKSLLSGLPALPCLLLACHLRM